MVTPPGDGMPCRNCSKGSATVCPTSERGIARNRTSVASTTAAMLDGRVRDTEARPEPGATRCSRASVWPPRRRFAPSRSSQRLNPASSSHSPISSGKNPDRAEAEARAIRAIDAETVKVRSRVRGRSNAWSVWTPRKSDVSGRRVSSIVCDWPTSVKNRARTSSTIAAIAALIHLLSACRRSWLRTLPMMTSGIDSATSPSGAAPVTPTASRATTTAATVAARGRTESSTCDRSVRWASAMRSRIVAISAAVRGRRPAPWRRSAAARPAGVVPRHPMAAPDPRPGPPPRPRSARGGRPWQ